MILYSKHNLPTMTLKNQNQCSDLNHSSYIKQFVYLIEILYFSRLKPILQFYLGYALPFRVGWCLMTTPWMLIHVNSRSEAVSVYILWIFHCTDMSIHSRTIQKIALFRKLLKVLWLHSDIQVLHRKFHTQYGKCLLARVTILVNNTKQQRFKNRAKVTKVLLNFSDMLRPK